MPRGRTSKVPLDEDEHANAMADCVKPGKKKSPRRPVTFKKICKEVHQMMGQKPPNWSKATPIHVVGLNAVLQELVYGVPPLIPDSRELMLAKVAARNFMLKRCHGNFIEVVDYLTWIWRRERGYEKYRRREHIDGKVLEWRTVYMYPEMWGKYQISIERQKHG